jgi:hypothetical protein
MPMTGIEQRFSKNAQSLEIAALAMEQKRAYLDGASSSADASSRQPAGGNKMTASITFTDMGCVLVRAVQRHASCWQGTYRSKRM